MIRFIAYLIGSLLSVLIVGSISSRLMEYQDREAVLIFALVLGFANAFVKPIVSLVTLPLSCLTFGLFAFVLNALFFAGADWLVDGIDANLWGTILGSIVASVVSGFVFTLVDER